MKMRDEMENSDAGLLGLCIKSCGASEVTRFLELFLLSEEQAEGYNGAVDEEAADNTHDHGRNLDLIAMCEDDR